MGATSGLQWGQEPAPAKSVSVGVTLPLKARAGSTRSDLELSHPQVALKSEPVAIGSEVEVKYAVWAETGTTKAYLMTAFAADIVSDRGPGVSFFRMGRSLANSLSVARSPCKESLSLLLGGSLA